MFVELTSIYMFKTVNKFGSIVTIFPTQLDVFYFESNSDILNQWIVKF